MSSTSPTTDTPLSPGGSKPKSQTYAGSCHCGRIAFTMKLSPPVEDGPVTSCNCSICHANGYLMVYPLDKNIEWIRGFDDGSLTTYRFAAGKIDHSFCSVCGISIGCKSNEKGGPFGNNRAINVRTLKGVEELEGLRIRKVDGRRK